VKQVLTNVARTRELKEQIGNLRGELRKIEAPTLVVVGDDDFICGRACADAIVRELRDGRLVTIPESGHFVYVEQPAAFRAALTGFLL